jgi:hypothetical protein
MKPCESPDTALKEIDNPFTAAGDRELAWAEYQGYLQRQVDRRMFDEAFGLRQMYVPLRGYFIQRVGGQNEEGTEGGHRCRVVHYADEIVDGWLAEADPKKAILIVEGGPGAGKSSFARMYAALRGTKGGRRTLIIPLHDRLFVFNRDLRTSVAEFVKNAIPFGPDDPLDPHSREQLLLIFDGLDELSRAGKMGEEVVRDFTGQVVLTVQQYNYACEKARLMVLLCGRPVAVDAARHEYPNSTVRVHFCKGAARGHGPGLGRGGGNLPVRWSQW